VLLCIVAGADAVHESIAVVVHVKRAVEDQLLVVVQVVDQKRSSCEITEIQTDVKEAVREAVLLNYKQLLCHL